jgi:hypothetical protein
MSVNVLLENLPSEVVKWKNIIKAIETENLNGHKKLRVGEKEVYQELKEFWKYNNYDPDRCISLINELKKHENYHAPRWEELGEFRRICLLYYTKERDVFEAFQNALGGKQKGSKNTNSNTFHQTNNTKESKNNSSMSNIFTRIFSFIGIVAVGIILKIAIYDARNSNDTNQIENSTEQNENVDSDNSEDNYNEADYSEDNYNEADYSEEEYIRDENGNVMVRCPNCEYHFYCSEELLYEVIYCESCGNEFIPLEN